LGFTDSDSRLKDIRIQGVDWIGEDQVIENYKPSEIRLVNGLGSVNSTEHRKRIYDEFTAKGYLFAAVCHPSAVIAAEVRLSESVQIMAGAILQTGCQIGVNTIINTKASIDHDCIIGSHVHIAPGATLSGNVKVETGVHIGTGATVIHNIRIGQESIVGAGSLVLKNVMARRMVIGVPAKEVEGTE
jgi:UDP-perosamine 4-acetyltransferase